MKRAFTLVELLVVLTITVVMIGLFIPALAGMRSGQRRAQCAVNLRSLRDATMQYVAQSGRGLLPVCDSPMVINGNCTEARIRQLLLAISEFLDAPVPDAAGYTEPLPVWSDSDSFPEPRADVKSGAPYTCPADLLYAPRVGISYDFAPSQLMLDMLTRRASEALAREESLRQEGVTRYGPPGPLWQDLNMDAHRSVAPAGILGCIGSYGNGKVDWVGYLRSYSTVR